MHHKCPVCYAAIFRKEVQTCGGVDCVAVWRSYSSAQKARMKEAANGNILESVEETPAEMTEELKAILAPKSTHRENDLITANEALKSIFGDKNEKEPQ